MPSPEVYTLSLHDALPISAAGLVKAAVIGTMLATVTDCVAVALPPAESITVSFSVCEALDSLIVSSAYEAVVPLTVCVEVTVPDRKSTRLNSSHSSISYAVARGLHSFPTRRSSDLRGGAGEGGGDRHDVGHRHRLRRRRAAAGRVHHRQLQRVRGIGQLDRIQRVRGGGAAHRLRGGDRARSEEHTSELQSQFHLVCRRPRFTLFPYTTLFRSPRRGW